MAVEGLNQTIQSDFSSAIFRSIARHLIPPNGLYDCNNGLLNQDGAIYKRGGSQALSTSNFGATGLRWIFDGQFASGRRTLFASTAAFGVLDGSEAPLNLGGAGLATPVRSAALNGVLFIGGGTMYGGSLKTANYSTGTVTTTNGSTTVTGSGTSFSANVDAGMFFRVSGERAYVVASVDSNTQITLADAYTGSSAGGKSYTLKQIESATTPYLTSSVYAVAGGRMLSCASDTVNFSNYRNPHVWTATDKHRIPEAVTVLGASGIENTARIYTTGGVWQITNMEYELLDAVGNPQQSLHVLTRDIVLWSAPGIVNWNGADVVPAVDGVWLVSESGYEKLSRSIDPLYTSYVAAGYHAGGAVVYNSHYVLPILDSNETVIDTLVCRLDRPIVIRGFGKIYPWTRLTGEGVNACAFTMRIATGTARQPKLLAAGRAVSGTYAGRVLDDTAFFTPDALRKKDHDGSTPNFMLETRDFATGPFNKNLVKRVRMGYRMMDAGTDNPAIGLDIYDGTPPTDGSYYGTAFYGTATYNSASYIIPDGSAPADDGNTPYTWKVGRRCRWIRLRLRNPSPTAELIVRTLEIFVRPSAKV